MKKYTIETFKEKLKAVHPTYEVPPLEIWGGSMIKIRIICPTHGMFEISPNLLLQGRGCSKCGRERVLKLNSLKKITQEDFIKKVKILHPTYGWEPTVYSGYKKIIKAICPIHGMFEILACSLLRGGGCKKCARSKQAPPINKITQEDFIKKVRVIHPTLKWSESIYNGRFTKIKAICQTHGIFETTPRRLLEGIGCKKCHSRPTSHNKLSQEEFIKRVRLIDKKLVTSEVVFVNVDTKVKLICPKHGVFDITPSNLLYGKGGCPKCKASKGEKFVSKWLQDNLYEYTPQKKFDMCKNIKELPFDFHLNNTNILIEYHGKQHFKVVPHWGGEAGLQQRMLHDHIKSKWARDNHYVLITLDYLMTDQEKLDMLETIKRYNCCQVAI